MMRGESKSQDESCVPGTVSEVESVNGVLRWNESACLMSVRSGYGTIEFLIQAKRAI